MNCCVNCFLDSEIRRIIKSQNNIGDCNFCNKTNTYIYDTNDSERLLSEVLYGLLSIYSTQDNLPSEFPSEKRELLRNILHRDWRIFNLEPEKIHKLIKAICSDKYTDYPELFDSLVGLPQICDEEYLKSNSLLKGNSWDNFVKAIKTENRFHLNYINMGILDSFVRCAKESYQAGEQFFRARISSNSNGFSINEMGAPPPHAAKAGRVNAEGISVLYLADSIDTAVYEVRAGRYDYITIGTFVLKEDINIVNLDLLNTISPFMFVDGGIAQYAINLPHLSRLSQEVARPLRRFDSSLDYLPTQYISDYIKSQPGISGITYGSTMAMKGINLAAFIPAQFECRSVKVIEINELQYRW